MSSFFTNAENQGLENMELFTSSIRSQEFAECNDDPNQDRKLSSVLNSMVGNRAPGAAEGQVRAGRREMLANTSHTVHLSRL